MVRTFLRFGSVFELSMTKSPVRDGVPTRRTMFSGTIPYARYVASAKSKGDVPRSLPPADTLVLKLKPATAATVRAKAASQTFHCEFFLLSLMIGWFSLECCRRNATPSMREESLLVCQRGDINVSPLTKAWKKFADPLRAANPRT